MNESRKARALLLVYDERQRILEEENEAVRRYSWNSPNMLRPIKIIDDSTEIDAFVAHLYSGGTVSFVISFKHMNLTFRFVCGTRLENLILRMMTGNTELYFEEAMNIIQESTHHYIDGTVLAFCLYCAWFNIKMLSMKEFPRTINVCDIRMHGRFPVLEGHETPEAFLKRLSSLAYDNININKHK